MSLVDWKVDDIISVLTNIMDIMRKSKKVIVFYIVVNCLHLRFIYKILKICNSFINISSIVKNSVRKIRNIYVILNLFQ